MSDCYDDPASSDSPGNERQYTWLDEFLCVYVDGTMEPAARLAFEEYLRANPELSAYVDRLCETRRLLCRFRHTRLASSCSKSARLHQRICQRVDAARAEQRRIEEQRREEAWGMILVQGIPLSEHLHRYSAWTAALALMLMLGILTGQMLGNPASLEAPTAVGQEHPVLNTPHYHPNPDLVHTAAPVLFENRPAPLELTSDSMGQHTPWLTSVAP